jgi:hypothetical protein
MSKVHEWDVHKLHPTQITVGLLEVKDRRRELESLKKSDQRDFLAAHPIPAVLGLDGKLFITDHHHLARAAWDIGIDQAFFLNEADLSSHDADNFWHAMAHERWVHPYDEHGVLRPYHEIPRHLEELRDDVYRSLACFVRRAGGFDKTPTAFAEFLWADFFRCRIRIGSGPADFQAALEKAIPLARSPEARALPGFRGG